MNKIPWKIFAACGVDFFQGFLIINQGVFNSVSVYNRLPWGSLPSEIIFSTFKRSLPPFFEENMLKNIRESSIFSTDIDLFQFLISYFQFPISDLSCSFESLWLGGSQILLCLNPVRFASLLKLWLMLSCDNKTGLSYAKLSLPGSVDNWAGSY